MIQMPHIPDKKIMEMVEAIVEASMPEEVILLGSQAADLAGPTSDVDLLVIMPSPFRSGIDRRNTTMRIEQALSQFSCAKDVLVTSRDEVEYWRDSLNNVIARALRTGKTIYERSETSEPAVVTS
jgi:predicted nucleotidyltransferase